MDKPSLHQFPVQFTLRVMGKDKDDFAGLVFALVARHVPGLSENALASRPSRAGKYISVAVTFEAQSKAQLDAIYEELSVNKRVLMVL